MASVAELCELALRYHQNGDLVQAEQLYRQILQADPNHADAHHLMGVLAFQGGNHHAARDHIQRAIALTPLASPFHNNLGLVYQALGQLENAQASYEEALRIAPVDRAALGNLSALLLRQRKLEVVVRACRQALSISADLAEIHQYLANALYLMGKLDEALVHFQNAVRLQPDFVEAHNNLGNLLFDIGRTAQAVEHFQQALALRPEFPEAHNNLARALYRQGKLDQAVRHFQASLRLAPDFAQGHSNLGSALAHQLKFDEAIASFRRAIEIDPSFAEAHSNLGATLVRSGRSDEAIVACGRAIGLQPRYFDAYVNLGGAYLDQGNLFEAAKYYRMALEIQPDFVVAQSNLLFCINYDPSADPDEVFAEHRRWGVRSVESGARRHSTSIGSPTPDSTLRTPTVEGDVSADVARLRIGYVSPDFREHAIIRYIAPVLANHDSRRVEIYCYADVSNPDEVTLRLQKYVKNWRSIRGLTASQAAQQIRDDGIDILVDLAGHTAGNRLDIFALKPAPIQATWLGYLNTTGLSTVDYRLTDEVLDPPGQPKRDTEELLYLPHGFCCFQPRENSPEISPLPALERGYLTFGSLHSLFKLNSAVYDLWSKVLLTLPTSRLLMYRDMLRGAAQQRVVHEFEQRGITQDRLDLKSSVRDSNHLLAYAEIDVSLDVLPWSGGVTTCESLWMGVPMLSLAGVRPTGRNSASILTQVGLSGFVCTTPEEFVARAACLPNELDKLAQLRRQLRESMKNTLCDARRFTNELEEAYRTMWQRRSSAVCSLPTEIRK